MTLYDNKGLYFTRQCGLRMHSLALPDHKIRFLNGLRRRIAVALMVGLAVVCSEMALAHPAPFSYLDFHITGEGLAGGLVIHDYDVAHDLGVDPPEALRDRAVV